jgi:hypothetical protein
MKDDRFAFSVRHGDKLKAFAWVWMERVDPKKPRIPNSEVLAVRVRDEVDKQARLDLGIEAFFTEPHYKNFPAILIRLKSIGEEELGELITNAWRCQAPALSRETLGGAPVMRGHWPLGHVRWTG